MLTEREAWMQIAAIIEGAPDMLEFLYYRTDGSTYGAKPAGLCSVVSRLRSERAITRRTENRMLDRIIARIGYHPYLHEVNNWTDGVRLQYCLQFAEEAGR